VTLAEPGSGGSTSSGTGPTTTSGGGASSSTGSSGGVGGAGATSSSSSQGGVGGAGSTGTGTGGQECPVSDPLATETISTCWEPLNEGGLVAGTSGPTNEGYYLAVPEANTGWWDETGGADDTAWMLHQSVTGPFVSYVHVETQAVDGLYQMAGLLVRSPTLVDGNEVWLKWETGRRGDAGGAGGGLDVNYGSIAAGNAFDHSSEWLIPVDETSVPPHAIDGAFAGRLGICRNGEHFMLAHRPDGGIWVVDHDVQAGDQDGEVPDLPDAVQLGLIANAYDATVNTLEARFSDFRISLEGVLTREQCALALTTLQAQ